MANSAADFKMVSIRKKEQQNKTIPSQLDALDADFMTGQNNHEAQAISKTYMVDIGSSSNIMRGPTQGKSPQVDIRTLRINIVGKVQSEADSVVRTVETRVQDAVLAALERLVFSMVELAMGPANASSGRSVDGNVLELDQKDFSSNVESLQMTALSKINSRTNFN